MADPNWYQAAKILQAQVNPQTGQRLYTDDQIAGILGNWQRESQMDPTALNRTGDGEYGIAQWNPKAGRLQAMQAWIDQQNNSSNPPNPPYAINDLRTQVLFSVEEEQGRQSPGVRTDLRAQGWDGCVGDACVTAYMKGYEKPRADAAAEQERINNARQYKAELDKMASDPNYDPATASIRQGTSDPTRLPGSGGGGGRGSPTSSRNLPNDEKIRDLKCVLPKADGTNPLHDLSNYTYRLIISILDNNQYNKFVTAKGNKGQVTDTNIPAAGTILIASGGEDLPKKNRHGVQDFFFKELILDTVQSGTVAAASNPTYALSIDFTLVEPLGTTLFERLYYAAKELGSSISSLSSIDPKIKSQIEAKNKEVEAKKGKALSLTEPIFLLTIEFKGYNMLTGKNSQPASALLGIQTKNTIKGDYYRKFQIPFVFSSIDTDITHAGTEYKIKAYPASSEVFWTNNQSIPAVTQLSENGKLNDILTELSDKWTTYHNNNIPQNVSPNKYIFRVINDDELPTGDQVARTVARTWRETTIFRRGAPADASRIQFMPPSSTGRTPGGGAGTTPYTPSRNQNFGIGMGTTAIEMAHQIMIRTDFIADEVKKAREGKAKDGIWWFNVRGRMTFDTANQSNNPHLPPGKIFEYIIEPYLIQIHNDIDQPAPCNVRTVRNYQYIFTGKNNDIIKWDLDYNGFLYSRLDVDEPNNPSAAPGQPVTGTVPSAAGQQRGTSSQYPTSYPTLNSPGAQGYNAKQYRVDWFKPDGKNAMAGRITKYDEVQTSAFMESLWRQQNSKQQWDLNIEIIGDPEYLSTYDTFGGFNATLSKKNSRTNTPTPPPPQSTPGQPPPQPTIPNPFIGQQVLVAVEFKTPVDVNPRTLQYQGMKPADLSRIYSVIRVKNVFRNGKFTQELKLVGTDIPCCFNADGTRYKLPLTPAQEVAVTGGVT